MTETFSGGHAFIKLGRSHRSNTRTGLCPENELSESTLSAFGEWFSTVVADFRGGVIEHDSLGIASADEEPLGYGARPGGASGHPAFRACFGLGSHDIFEISQSA